MIMTNQWFRDDVGAIYVWDKEARYFYYILDWMDYRKFLIQY